MRFVKNWLEILTGSFLLILVITTFLQVLFRFAIKIPAPWTEEVTRISFVYMIFLGAALGVKYSRHLSVDVINNLPPQIKKVIITISYALSIVFMGTFTYFGWVHAVGSRVQTTPTLEISLLYLYLILPVSGLIMTYYLVKGMIMEIQGKQGGGEAV